MRVLIIDDDPDIGDFLQVHLPAHGFAVDVAESGLRGLEFAHINEYDLVILDVNLPDLGGEAVCTEIRRSGRTMPILMLSVVFDSASKTRLLNAGADDYLTKPFSFEELLARLHALLRRQRTLVPDVLRIRGIALDSLAQTVRRGKRSLDLTGKEFAVLEYLMRRAGFIVPKTALIEHIWDNKSDPFSGSVDVHMANLRRKLGSPGLIHTVHGRGYRFADGTI